MWDRVAMDILDMSVTTDKGNQYVLSIVDCFKWAVKRVLSISEWTMYALLSSG